MTLAMETYDIIKIDSRILELSEKFQKAMEKPNGSSVILGIKRELTYWREQRKMLLSQVKYRRA